MGEKNTPKNALVKHRVILKTSLSLSPPVIFVRIFDSCPNFAPPIFDARVQKCISPTTGRCLCVRKQVSKYPSRSQRSGERKRERCRFERICHYVPHQLKGKNQTKASGDEQKQTTRWIEIEREEARRRRFSLALRAPAGARFPCFYNIYTMQARLLNTFRVKCASFSLINETCIGECDAATRENTFENSNFFITINECISSFKWKS